MRILRVYFPSMSLFATLPFSFINSSSVSRFIFIHSRIHSHSFIHPSLTIYFTCIYIPSHILFLLPLSSIRHPPFISFSSIHAYTRIPFLHSSLTLFFICIFSVVHSFFLSLSFMGYPPFISFSSIDAYTFIHSSTLIIHVYICLRQNPFVSFFNPQTHQSSTHPRVYSPIHSELHSHT